MVTETIIDRNGTTYKVVTTRKDTHAVDIDVWKDLDLINPEYFIHGFLKWDGCFNFNFPDTKNCMLHVCDQKGLQHELDFVMANIYKLGHNALGEVADFSFEPYIEKEVENE